MNKRHQRGFALLPLLFVIVAVAAAAGIGYAISTQTDLFLSKSENTNIVACTEEAKLCPDGSSVGRTGPNCAFANCPAANTNTAVNTNTTVIPTADWKTYTNTTYGFNFRYPSEFNVGGVQTSQRASFTNETMGDISVDVSNKQYSADDLTSGQNEFSDVVQATVGPKSGYAYSYADAGCGMRYYRLPLTGATLFISFGSCETNTEPMSKQLEAQVLSTFVFTDVTADWKTYTNTKYGFSIKYPSTWVKVEVNSASLDGKPLVFTQLSDSLDKDGAMVISYLNSPSLFQDGKWDPSTGQITSVGGRATTSTVYTPDLSTPWAVKPTPKEKIVFTVEPSGWVNRGTAKDVNGSIYEWGNGDIQLLGGATGNFNVLNTILATLTFTK